MSEKLEIADLLEFAVQTAEEAGKIALTYFRLPIEVGNKSSGSNFDPVTKADREIELFIRDRINSAYPDHRVIGEEAGVSEGSSNLNWFIDPIDGTRSFISGVPLWGILIGLMENDEHLFGLMHQPYLNETFTGSGHGAFLNTGKNNIRPIRTGKTESLEDAIIYSTHPSHFSRGADYEVFRKIAEQCKLMRYGGDCYCYCLLAHGCIDLVMEAGLNAYDIVPLIPIIEAAGGIVSDWQGNRLKNGGNVIASANPALHDKVLAQIRNLNRA